MKILGLLCLLLTSAAYGQNKITVDITTEFVNEKINDLNLQVWDAVHSGKIHAFWNDSLVSVKPPSEIRNQANPILEDRSTVINGVFVDSSIYGVFDSLNGFKGVALNYTTEYSKAGINFKLEAIAPLYTPTTVSGFNLGMQPLFFVKTESLQRILSSDEYAITIALLKQRMSLGDFMNPYFYDNNKSKEYGQTVTFNTVYGSPYWHVWTAPIDTAIGSHLFSLFTFSSNKYQQDKGVDIFYKDEELKDAYKYVPFDLADTLSFQVPNPDNPDNPKDLISMENWQEFRFHSVSEIELVGSKKNLVVKLINKKGKADRIVYVRYAHLSQYMNQNDRIVLDALIQKSLNL